MNDVPRRILCRILDEYGAEISSDAKRCQNLLNDLCGAHRREINVLISAIEQDVPHDLLTGAGAMPLELLLTRTEKRLAEQTALTSQAARWAVESWALALKLATESEIQTRSARNEPPAPPIFEPPTQPPPNESGKLQFPNAERQNPVRPPTFPSASSPPRRAPPIIRQPAQSAQSAQSAPPVTLPTVNQSSNSAVVPAVPPPLPTTITQSVSAGKGFGLFRGCLLFIFLLAAVSVVLFFGVPYAIEVMRETQRQKTNEPPRFPVR